MAKSNKSVTILEEKIIDKIYLIRGKKVMLDRDLAELYGVETRVLNQAVNRNKTRFPSDFMFRLSEKELNNLISQIVISSWGGVRKAPLAFTEQGVAMLSSVLNSETAVKVNIKIIRAFSRMREMLLTHKDILIKLEQVEKKLLKHDTKMNKHEEDMQLIFAALRGLLASPPEPEEEEPRPPIGFKRNRERD